MKLSFSTFFLTLFLLPILVFGQTYDGPAAGQVSSGVTVSTDNFLRTAPLTQPMEKHIRNTIKDENKAVYLDIDAPAEGSNYFEDPSLTTAQKRGVGQTVLLRSFTGIPETNSIPPDPYVAAGPTHIVATVNSSFAIWDKEGNLVKTINADAWYSSVLPGVGAFDPKVLYNHFAKRWIMVWLHQNDATQQSYYLFSVSDDSIPTGTWYNWALPSNQNGSTVVSNWGDYQGVGFDEDGVYISSNQFQFGGSYQYVKIRVIPTAQLLANNAGKVEWNDLWNISYPSSPSKVFNIRPSVSYGGGDGFYLLHAPGGGGNFMSVYKITNAATTPALSGFNVPVTYFSNAPNANQLGGSTTLIDGAGSYIRNEPKYRDGYLYATHSVGNPAALNFSNVRYVKLDVAHQSAVEDVSFGAIGYWHIYSAIDVDKDGNIALTYSRSGDTEYCGAFYTTRLSDDPPGLNPSSVLQPGYDNYVKTYSGTRNRWGDYNGISLDPVDQNNFWLFSEHVASLNTWGTWTGMIRLVPFEGMYVFPKSLSIDFPATEITYYSDTVTVFVSNYGTDPITISDIQNSVGPFMLADQYTFPIQLNSYDSLGISIVFNPTTPDSFNLFLGITSNSPELTGIALKGKGFSINPAADNSVYAASGILGGSNILLVEPYTGTASVVGFSNYDFIKSIAIHPTSKEIFGINSDSHGSSLIKVNALEGDSYLITDFTLPDISALAFTDSAELIAADLNGVLYKIDIGNKTIDSLVSTNMAISSLSFNPVNNELWASLYLPFGLNKDQVFKIDMTTGDTTLVGKTGLNVMTQALCFDAAGHLFGVTGSSNQVGNFVSIDTATAQATVIGTTGVKNITGLAYTPGTITSAKGAETTLPTDFSLKQNYPNPFNPSTTIEFALPIASDLKVTIYNIVGEVVNTLINTNMSAGYHRAVWNARDNSGNRVSSGVYFYEVKANGVDGRTFSQMKKMILLK
ncbi:MAG: T9SS type A sorting domain-containing protein [Ignavibacteriaceae bacterium]|nr:T9SS type A sorting domain-containing protein [Ignavibacteriaceae bacterium]